MVAILYEGKIHYKQTELIFTEPTPSTRCHKGQGYLLFSYVLTNQEKGYYFFYKKLLYLERPQNILIYLTPLSFTSLRKNSYTQGIPRSLQNNELLRCVENYTFRF